MTKKDFNYIESYILDKIKNVNDRKSYDTTKSEIFGKKGIFTELFGEIGNIDKDQGKDYLQSEQEVRDLYSGRFSDK